ncbi:MAG: TraR/DksA C4-type zinc finger protein [Candidatus Paceibacterota bacterium]|jgi:RNA polymerase-binding transcription factor DksA
MKNTEHFKELLLEEKKQLEKELGSVGRVNPLNTADWEGTPGDTENIDAEDENSLADKFEEFEERSAVETELEVRLNEINAALERTEKGGYGICRVCQGEIEDERLEANPAAETCKGHINN